MGLDALELDAARSLLVGDRALDLAAAKAAGLPRGILVATGYGGEPAQRTQARALADETFAVDIRPSIAGQF
jgi:phosphoglycolate phosphatase-like HAD superfamily hydrolase